MTKVVYCTHKLKKFSFVDFYFNITMLLCNLGYEKYKLFDVTSLFQFFQRFDWYNSHCQGLDVEWKVYFLFQKLLSNGTKENHVTRLKLAEYKTHVIKEQL